MKKQKATALDDSDTGLANTLKAEVHFDGENLDALLRAAIHELPEKQKQVFLLRYYDEMSYKEMAEILDTSVGGLKASYHHAAKKVEEYIKARI